MEASWIWGSWKHFRIDPWLSEFVNPLTHVKSVVLVGSHVSRLRNSAAFPPRDSIPNQTFQFPGTMEQMFKSVEVKLMRGREKRNPQLSSCLAQTLLLICFRLWGPFYPHLERTVHRARKLSTRREVSGYGATEDFRQTGLEGKQRQPGRIWEI